MSEVTPVWFTTSKGGLARMDKASGMTWFLRPEGSLKESRFFYIQQDAPADTKPCELTAAGGILEWELPEATKL